MKRPRRRIHKYMKAFRLSRQELADKSGLSVRTIHYLFAGCRITHSTAIALGAVMGIPWEDLYEEG